MKKMVPGRKSWFRIKEDDFTENRTQKVSRNDGPYSEMSAGGGKIVIFDKMNFLLQNDFWELKVTFLLKGGKMSKTAKILSMCAPSARMSINVGVYGAFWSLKSLKVHFGPKKSLF